MGDKTGGRPVARQGRGAAALAACVLLACASPPKAPAVVPEEAAGAKGPACDAERIGQLERQLAERQRQCQEERRRLEGALKESLRQKEELQKKLDALLSIDRDLRRTRER